MLGRPTPGLRSGGGRRAALLGRPTPGLRSVAGVLLAVVLAAVAFLARGGTELGRTTAAEILLVAVGVALVAAALLSRRRGPVHGAAPLIALGALVVFTALSVGWSVVPDLSFVEAGRSFAYLAVFAGAVAAARLAPTASPVVLRGVLAAAVAVCAYALISRVWPASLGQNEFYARLGQPFGYWNAVGAVAAIGLVPALWLGARRPARVLERALAFPACGVLLLALLLTQSRGALAAAVLGALVWFAVVPLRLRSLAVLGVAAAGAAPVAVWALSKDAFTVNFIPLAERQGVAAEFGLLVVAMVVGLVVAGLAVSYGMARVVPSMRVRRRIGLAALAAVLAVPIVVIASVAASERGLAGTISDRVGELTSETSAAPPEGAGRLTVSSSSRARYWREAGDVFAERPGKGTGAGTFYVSRLRYRKDELVAQHAHGYVPQTMSDLGVVGLVLSALLLLAWVVCALRATALVPRLRRHAPPRPPLEWSGERTALIGLLAVALVFGLQSAIDWTWFVPGVAAMGLAAAGFVAGRGALAASATGATASLAPEPAGTGLRRRPPWPRIAAAVGVVVTGALLAGAIWQPERSSRANARALGELERGDLASAANTARSARESDPLSPRPRFAQASIAAAGGRDTVARKILEGAVLTFPGDPQTWLRLAEFELSEGQPRRSLEVIRGALYLDPFSKAARRVRAEARTAALAQIRRRTRSEATRRRERALERREIAPGGANGGSGKRGGTRDGAVGGPRPRPGAKPAAARRLERLGRAKGEAKVPVEDPIEEYG